ncbi:hypothetical protein V1227_08475 [Lentzea sp. DG1S-22]|uniref:hypothetical protein n=1 Tax=Lentzea sp. DG1S-22 TaxID=3108822 RepID=UPI002E766CEF|nr:hypothetical protein [Lentzea sp. DG1S-22]WVH82774.1 hypothetical protein V1227_08475 [Lentzea sp. DG1S-22]
MARIPDCPLGRTVDAVGGWWALEVLHEVFDGHSHASAVAKNLGLPFAVAAERLAALVAAELLCCDDQGDHEPTAAGLALRPLLLVMAAWGNRDLAPQERSLMLVDPATGREVDPVVVDSLTGEPLTSGRCVFVAGPAASRQIRARYPDQTERLTIH